MTLKLPNEFEGINGKEAYEKLFEIFNGWNAYAIWSNSYNLRKRLANKIPIAP